MGIFAKPSELDHLAYWLVRKRRGEIIRVFSGAERLEFESSPLRRKVHKIYIMIQSERCFLVLIPLVLPVNMV